MDLIRPHQPRHERSLQNRRGRAAAGGVMLLAACFAVIVMGRPHKDILGQAKVQELAGGLSRAEMAVAAASAAKSEVSDFMTDIAGKEEAETEQSVRPLDWNWWPEMQRDQHVHNWVGRNFVAPYRGTKPLKPLTWEQHMQHPWHAAAVANKEKEESADAQKGDADEAAVSGRGADVVDGGAGVGVVEGAEVRRGAIVPQDAVSVSAIEPQPEVERGITAEVPGVEEHRNFGKAMKIPSIRPLRYFPHNGMQGFDTDFIVNQAQNSVAKAYIDPEKVRRATRDGYVRPKPNGMAGEAGVTAEPEAAKEEFASEQLSQRQQQPSSIQERLMHFKQELAQLENEVKYGRQQ